jgi:uncharacterized protein with PQ loop repeat
MLLFRRYYVVNCFLWLIYGCLIVAPPMIVANAVALVIGIVQFVLKLKYSDSPLE